MEDSILCLDVYPNLFEQMSWSTLIEMHQINRHFKWLAEREIKRRWESNLPLGDKKAKLIIITENIYLENIFCWTSDSKVCIDNWNRKWLRQLFTDLFYYSMSQNRYVITNKLFREMIRLFNHKISHNAEPVSEYRQTLIFHQTSSGWILQDFS